MSYTATYNESPSTYPWLQVFMAMQATGTVNYYSGSNSSNCASFSYDVNQVGALIVVAVLYECNEGETGEYTISDSGSNAWTLVGQAYVNDPDENLWGLQVWCCTALATGIIDIATTVPSDCPHQHAFVTEWDGSFDSSPVPVSLLTAESGYNSTGVPSVNLTAASPEMLFSVGAVISGGDSISFSRASPFTANAFSSGAGDLSWDIIGEYLGIAYDGPPPAAPPLRYKRIPLTLDFANTTWDQQSRLMQYELYRSLGLDQDPWTPPVTMTMTVWSEAVDDEWNVLKLCKPGQVITIDPSVSFEFAGDWEIMEITYHPFQGNAGQLSVPGGGDPSTVAGSSALAMPADPASGTLVMVLRTYNEDVFIDEAKTPSYANVPGPVVGDPEE